MEHSQPESQVEMELLLVEELKRMRDALTRLSLAMHDLNFSTDVKQQKVAQEMVTEFMSRNQS
jgi:Ni,Fe-hydrogenase III large subunit